MGFIVNLATLVLPLLLIVGVFGTLKLASENGTFKLIDQGIEASKLPGTSLSLRRHWTGFSQVDHSLCSIASFFYPMFDGQHPSLSIQTAHFFGQLSSIWLVLLVESARVGNVWRIISFVTIWGIAIENIAMAIILPLYCFVHLLTSPTARSPESMPLANRKTSLLVHPIELEVLPWSAGIGTFVPVLLIFYFNSTETEPFWISQQFWIVARNFHPILTAAVHLFLSMVTGSGEPAFTSTTNRNRVVLRRLDRVYSLATLVSVVSHASTMTLILSTRLYPSLLTPPYRAAFDPVTVFQPVSFWKEGTRQVQSVPMGALIFLQWDELVSCAAILVWAVALNRQAISNGSITSFLAMVVKTTLLTVVGGPAAAAISLIKERDHLVLDKIETNEDKKKS